MRWPFGWWQSALDPNAAYVVLTRWKLAYGRIPKAANSAIRSRLARLAGLPKSSRIGVNRDAFWADEAKGLAILTGRALTERYPDATTFTVVRNPFDRLASCYVSKLVSATAAAPLGHGFRREMPFSEFVATVAAIPDDQADVHFRAQTAILFSGGHPPDLTVLRLEQLSSDWAALRTSLIGRLDIGGPLRPRQRPSGAAPTVWTDALLGLVRERYADDLAAFYPDVEGPSQRKSQN